MHTSRGGGELQPVAAEALDTAIVRLAEDRAFRALADRAAR